MEPTTSGRFRVHDRRPRPDIDGTGPADPPEEFVLVDYPEAPIDPTAPDAGDRFDPLYAAAEGYDGDMADRVASLEPGFVVDATLAWTDGSARFADVEVVRESRFRFADDVDGMLFEAAVDVGPDPFRGRGGRLDHDPVERRRAERGAIPVRGRAGKRRVRRPPVGSAPDRTARRTRQRVA